jgi:hypothetical protein
MKANMKTSRIKKVVVKGSSWEDCLDIDSDIHDDFLLEAATRALESRRYDPELKVAAIVEVWEQRNEKNPDKHYCYNSYMVMVNASMYKQAEYLRSVYLNREKNPIDLKSLSLKEESSNGKSGNK